ncbi:PucR family transcriptional regulator ligand-binding domain-containing protein, partial [Streptomyces sp. SID5785]|uniref:PucR family transcriptional regulator ligand-binding domain-containing protein n=1 Tax=Streptomyces sp. SID5785 TaxID=2690309 RepID=UPI0031BA100C
MPVPAPPTSGVPLAALLARTDLGLRQIAGPDPAGVLVHGAHTSELPDPRPYLLGGELLLTAGVQAGETAFDADTGFDAYAARVVAGGAVALGFGVAPVHDTVPPALVAACDAHGLPLVEVPPAVPFSGIARAVWELMAQARHAELRRVTEAQQALASAAARPGPVRAVLRQLAQRTGGYAVAVTADGRELDAAGA